MSRPADKFNDEPMVRKPILMPPTLITEIEKMAKKASEQEKRSVSLAEVVRRALMEYDPNAKTDNDEILNTLLDGIIKSTKETTQVVRKLNKKLDKSYKELMHGDNG